MLFNNPNAKKNPTLPWERKKITLFDRLEVLVGKRKRRKDKIDIAIDVVKTIRGIRKYKNTRKAK